MKLVDLNGSWTMTDLDSGRSLAASVPGYRTLAVAPRPGGGISSATTAHLTPYGRAEVAWRRADGQLTAEVLVPAGCRALVTLPGLEPADVGAGQHHFECAYRDPVDDPAYVHPLLAAAEFP